MNKKIKILVSVLLVCVLITAGTFAWVNLSQNVLNEFEGDGSHPGGTTHDDFNEPKKDVYVENWGKTPIFVRIRLDEYMEIGKGAGLKGTEPGEAGIMLPNPDNLAKSLMPGADINNMDTWSPHIPDNYQHPAQPEVAVCNTTADFHHYWQWGMGGSKYYMPVSETDRADPAYVDQNITEYDGSEPGVKQTLNADVITMADWTALGQPIGNYWVIDTDGWAYWAAPLDPDSATGLLLNSVTRTFDIEDSYYYAINVVVQMATKTGDDNYTDFYNDFDSDHTATDDGKDLLEIITGAKPVPATKVTINGGDKTMNVGDTYTPGCVVEPSNSTDGPVWSSSDNGVATVDPNTGKITAVGPGTAVITVTAGNQTDSITITVGDADIPATDFSLDPSNFNLNGDTLELHPNETYPLVYTLEPDNTTDKITWTSSDESVATVDENGVITAVANGDAIITGTVNGMSDFIKVKVTPSTNPATSVTLSNGDQTLDVGDTYAIPAAAVDIEPQDTTDTPVWSTSDSDVATVDPTTGTVAAVGPGTATITLTVGDKSASYKVTVKQPAADLILSASALTLTEGETSPTITAALVPANSTDTITWTSDNAAVAVTPSADGKTATVTGNSAVTAATVTVKAGSITKTIAVTVNKGEDPTIPTVSGEGPYDTVYDQNNADANYALVVKIKASQFVDEIIQETLQNGLEDGSTQEGSIKLSAIFGANDYSGVDVKAQDPSLSKYFHIGTDKDGDAALMYTYIPAKSLWDAGFQQTPSATPVETVNLLLTKDGYSDTPIKVTVRYNQSMYLNQ